MLIFENELMIRYQIQEMLRVEKIFEEDGIAHELQSYAPLVPTGSNFKVTLQIEYAEETERRRMLGLLKGVENRVWVRVDGFDPVFAVADEDLERGLLVGRYERCKLGGLDAALSRVHLVIQGDEEEVGARFLSLWKLQEAPRFCLFETDTAPTESVGNGEAVATARAPEETATLYDRAAESEAPSIT